MNLNDLVDRFFQAKTTSRAAHKVIKVDEKVIYQLYGSTLIRWYSDKNFFFFCFYTNYFEFSPTTQRAFRRFGIVFSNRNNKLTLKQINYKGGRFRTFDVPIKQGQVLLIKYYTHDISVWVARESSVDSFMREFRVEEVSNLLRSERV